MSTAKIIQKQLEICKIVTEMNQIGTVGNINYSIKDSKYFYYETSITERLEDSNTEKENVEIIVPLKDLSNLWRTLDITLINCEISLILT